jgi:hypothetical protein
MPLNTKRVFCVSYREHGMVVDVLNAARDMRRDCLDNDGIPVAARTSRVAGATLEPVQPMPKLYIHPRNAAGYHARDAKIWGSGAWAEGHARGRAACRRANQARHVSLPFHLHLPPPILRRAGMQRPARSAASGTGPRSARCFRPTFGHQPCEPPEATAAG